ncbi:hypothetical protein HDU80_011811 [Chytriomyces hyalinus]|nr:hypothetical protein HDU80_011811 [Chytriomyces hyalinus]
MTVFRWSRIAAKENEESIPALVESLKGVDALVSVVGGPGMGSQEHLIRASVQAGVKRFFPSEYGIDLDLHALSIAFVGAKVPIRNLLRTAEISSKLKHIIYRKRILCCKASLTTFKSLLFTNLLFCPVALDDYLHNSEEL